MMRKATLILFVTVLVTVGGAFSPKPFTSSPSLTKPQQSNLRGVLYSADNDDITDNDDDDDVVLDLRGGALPKLPDIPTMVDYRRFALPCLGLWVMGPLLSLVDTAFVGLSGDATQSAAQLAALGPATTFFDGATYLFAFLNVATTNLYSSARAQYGEDAPRTESVVRTAARVALYCGFAVTTLLLLFSRSLLALYVGHDTPPEILDWATDYVKIRALSMPTSLLLGVLQAALLGAKDSVTPLVAVAYSMVVNIIGDYICVNRLGRGLQGAALATLFAQWASTYALVGPARQKLVKDHDLGLTSNKHRSQKNAQGTVTGRTFMAFAAPVITLILGKLAAFGFMTHAAAGLPGQPTTLASHQIILSTFFFISPFLEVISQTAQTFLPPFTAPIKEYILKMTAKNPSFDPKSDTSVQSWASAAFSVATTLLSLSLVVASIIATIVSLIPAFFGNVITTDHVVQQAVKPLAKYLWAGAFLTAPVAVSEGVLLARRELPFLASVYLVSSVILPFALIEIKKRGLPVVSVWGCFAAFQLFRATCFAGRIWGGKLLDGLTGMTSHKSNKPQSSILTS